MSTHGPDETLQVCDLCCRASKCEPCEYCDTLLCAECRAKYPSCIWNPAHPDFEPEPQQ